MEIHIVLLVICTFVISLPTLESSNQYTFPQFERIPPQKVILPSSAEFVNLSTVVYPVDCRVSLITVSESVQKEIATDGNEPRVSRERGNNVLYVSYIFQYWKRYQHQRLAWRATNSLGSVMSRPFVLQSIHVNKFPNEQDETLNILLGNNARIVCNLPSTSPSPPPIMNFLLNDTKIDLTGENSRYRPIFVKGNSYNKMVLIISSLGINDAGFYTCQVGHDNVIQNSIKRTKVVVTTSKQIVLAEPMYSSPKTLHVTEGSTFTIYCIFKVAPPNDVSWYWKNSKNSPHIVPNNNLGILTFNQVKYEDGNKKYTCMVGSSKNTLTFNIVINKRLKLIATPKHTQIDDSTSSVELTCEIQAPRNQTVTPPAWIFNSTILHNSDKYKITSSYLQINNIDKSTDLGIYQCYKEDLTDNEWVTAAASITRLSSTVTNVYNETERLRHILGSNFETKLKKIYTHRGDMKHIKCSVDSTKKNSLKIKWKKVLSSRILQGCKEFKSVNNTRCIDHNDSVSVLTILNLSENDVGYYICEIYNRSTNEHIGSDYFHLLFEPKSEKAVPPLISFVKVSNDTDWLPLPKVFLRWQVPHLPSSSDRMDHYRIEYSRMTDPSEDSYVQLLRISTKNKHLTLTDPDVLLPNHYYKFRIIGRDLKDSTIFSNWSSLIFIRSYTSNRVILKSITCSKTGSFDEFTLTASFTYNENHPTKHGDTELYCRKHQENDSPSRNVSWQYIMSRPQSYSANYLDKSNFIYGTSKSSFNNNLSITVDSCSSVYMCFLSVLEENPLGKSHVKLSNILILNGALPYPPTTELISTQEPYPHQIYPQLRTTQSPLASAIGSNVTVLVLGSLAGILFIVALLLILLYLWKRFGQKAFGRACSPSENCKSVHGQPLTPVRYQTNHSQSHYHPPYLPNYMIGQSQQDDHCSGYLDPIGAMNEQKQRLLNQSLASQSDQASAIYSQVGSDSFDVEQTDFVNVYAHCPPPYFDVASPPQNYQDFYPMTSYHPGLSTTLNHRGVYDTTASPMRQNRVQMLAGQQASPCHILPNRMTESPQLYRAVNSPVVDHSPHPPSYLTSQKSQPMRMLYTSPHHHDMDALHSRAVHPLPLPPPLTSQDSTLNNKKRQYKQLPKTGVMSVLSTSNSKGSPQLPLYSNPIVDNNNVSGSHSAYSSNSSNSAIQSSGRTDTTSCERV